MAFRFEIKESFCIFQRILLKATLSKYRLGADGDAGEAVIRNLVFVINIFVREIEGGLVIKALIGFGESGGINDFN